MEFKILKISREYRHEHSLVVIKSDSFAELALFLFITVKKLGTICTISLSYLINISRTKDVNP